MTVVINGTTGISPVTAAGTSALVDGMTVGRGAGEVATNTAVGASALSTNSTAAQSTAVGYQASFSDSTGGRNTSIGYQAGYTNTAESGASFAGGYQALKANTSGRYNIAIGGNSALANTTASGNIAVGQSALETNTTGAANVAVGSYDGTTLPALYGNTTVSNNVAMGVGALKSNTTASNNTAVGYQAGYSNTTGTYQTFVGYTAGHDTTGTNSTFVGQGAGYFVTTGAKNTILGQYNGNQSGLDIRTASNYVVLSDGDGNPLAWWGIGYTFLPSAYSITTASAANLFVNTDGTLRRSTSALKYKQDIRDIESIDINLLRGVRYKSKSKDDDQTKDHFGVIADEVDAAGIKELVIYGADGEVEGFQYERLTVVLLKAIQELKAEFDAYKATHP